MYIYIYILIDAICLSGIFGSNKNPGEDLNMLKCQPSSRSTSELQKKTVEILYQLEIHNVDGRNPAITTWDGPKTL